MADEEKYEGGGEGGEGLGFVLELCFWALIIVAAGRLIVAYVPGVYEFFYAGQPPPSPKQDSLRWFFYPPLLEQG